MKPKIEIEIDPEGYYLTLILTEDFELHGSGGNLAEALYELAEQAYGGGL